MVPIAFLIIRQEHSSYTLYPNCTEVFRHLFNQQIFSKLTADLRPRVSSLDGSLWRRLDEALLRKNSRPCQLETSNVRKTILYGGGGAGKL